MLSKVFAHVGQSGQALTRMSPLHQQAIRTFATTFNSTQFLEQVTKKNTHEKEFLQAVTEVIDSLEPILAQKPHLASVLPSLVIPERTIMFRVPWIDDRGVTQVNQGYRVQFNSAIGPYKGGLRFHPSVNLSILKFLGFEQILKNSLTGLPMGGGKGGSDFDPKGKSDNEIQRFCQSFMTSLARHIGPNTDVPAGDIGVGGREIGFLFGQYKRIQNEWSGTLTGKGLSYGGSLIRPEATGYGAVYFANEMLKVNQDSMRSKLCLVSGSGNVAQYAIQKITQLGGMAVTCSDSNGFIYDKDGIDSKKLDIIMKIKNSERGRISDYVKAVPSAVYTPVNSQLNYNPLWAISGATMAFPCATQNEINQTDARNLVKGGVKYIVEGANMPSTPEAIDVYLQNKIRYAPGKASNAGGVATSGLEMSQNSLRLSWTKEDVDSRLKAIMVNIHDSCWNTAKDLGHEGNYMLGANCAGFQKVAEAMVAQGAV